MKTFGAARLKLTLWYVFIFYGLLALFTIAVISAEKQAFAQVIALVNSHVRGVVFNVYLQQQIADFENNFWRWLLLFDGVILVVAAISSYFLSGRTLAPIERAMQEQERFTADASHELRTPLASMAMELEAYQRGAKSKTATDQLVISLQEEVQRMAGIVSGLMKLVRLEQDESKSTQSRSLIDMSDLVQTTSGLLAQPTNQAHLHYQQALDSHQQVWGNTDELKQVVLILLDNAIKYTPSKGRIVVTLSDVAKQVQLTIFNSGPGITKEDLPRVFERFYRGKNAGDEGSGLGLAIARSIVEAHGGSIAAASQKDKGVTIRVLLPAKSKVK